ncbi:alpha-N-acetylglucosaminidase [Coraliomargarita sp. SDUM461003]|uniref:Alpha-N-acetylglucosaminidase n=1 Tax=Thalassobacterium maritimum TaxID=3041265 RepID=A0ABU1AQD5_9BACT|nr:alpha-N-acetylglucosaminidase [Coraliomargarita sp. SDUM461003]MDQ8206384.1 alpha-N-acetylglucosaminidase [Coraliomargarita sp. SDUM461003]
MKHIRSSLALLFIAIGITQIISAATPADHAAHQLITRIAPEHANKFIVDTSLPKVDGKDVFSVSDTADGKILIRGNNGVSVASGFNWYLKNRAFCHLSWCGDQMDIPTPLPQVGESVTVNTPLKRRTYFNYCTLSYTGAWWNWENRWEREIDFMAMQGINHPLSVIGLEAVWYETLLKYGFTDLEAREFLVGPAFFAWQWMTNIEAHGGPLPKSWIDQSKVLGKKIIDRQIELGMTPIQQGFTGHVPRLLKEKFPDNQISYKHNWVWFEGAAQLDPLDPLFDEMGRTFLAKQEEMFGTSHLYGCDPFHEGSPPVEGDDYLAKVGKKIHTLIKAHDPEGKIAMQSWTIRKPIATAIPKEDIFILDLGGKRHERNDDFWDIEFVAGPLNNFGGRINLHGDLALLASNPYMQWKNDMPNYVGMGLFMEGIDNNPVYYELAFDLIWKDGPVDLTQWLHHYAHRRYGAPSENANKAWDLIAKGPYGENTDGTELSSMVAARPEIDVKKSGPNAGFKIPYSQIDLLNAWFLLLKDADKLKDSDGYRFDIVDIGRQVLSNHAQNLHPKVKAAWEKRDLQAFDQATKEFETLLLDIDTLIRPREEYSLNKWISDARSFGTTEAESDLYEKNARTLVTLWGPLDSRGPRIFDYGWREWSGLIKDYYLVRWQKHNSMLRQHIVDGTPYDESKIKQVHGRAALRANDFFDELADWEMDWATLPGKVDSPATSGDEVELAKRFYNKYEKAIRELTQDQHLLAKLKQNPGEIIGSCNSENINVDQKSTRLSFPVTDYLEGEGNYFVTFKHKQGPSNLKLLQVELLEAGKVISTDKHSGWASRNPSNNIYTVECPEPAFGIDYSIRITAQGRPENKLSVDLHFKKAD